MRRLVALAAVMAVSCAWTAPAAAPKGPPPSEIEALKGAPWLQSRVLGSSYGYFRFVNARFAGEVCKRFETRLGETRRVNLHGDAHVEQYAITDTGRGLSDFDDSASGPPVIDLVRFATAVHLTARARGWTATADEVVKAFLRGYRAALENPGALVPEPSIVGRVRAGFKIDPDEYFEMIRKMGEPVSPELDAQIKKALGPYVELQRARDTSLPPSYFEIVELAQTHIGIGSALAQKYLVRLRGPSDDPRDDIVLEVKEVSAARRGPCLDLGAARDPLRLLTTQARIAYEPYRHPGYMSMNGTPFWVHAWARAYVELSAPTFASQGELMEVAYDVGVQLGLGHPRYIAAPFDAELRNEILDKLTTDAPVIESAARDLADMVEKWWREAKGAM